MDKKLQDIGQCAFDSIEGMVTAVNVDYDRLEELREATILSNDEVAELEELEAEADGNECLDDAIQVICEDPLSVMVRDDWRVPGGDTDCTEYDRERNQTSESRPRLDLAYQRRIAPL